MSFDYNYPPLALSYALSCLLLSPSSHQILHFKWMALVAGELCTLLRQFKKHLKYSGKTLEPRVKSEDEEEVGCT